jgi:lysophospholipase L1-like esterase
MNKTTPLFLGLLLAQAVTLRAQSLPWTGTWGVTPQSGGNTFNNQTIRQIVYTSAGGSAARIRLSNLFGSQSVLISDVHIALAGTGSSIQPGTDHVVTFGGSGSVTVGAGADVNSDSVPMTIPSLSEVAISFYLPNSTNVQTYHQFSFQTVYVANGDVSGNTSLSVASTQGSYFFLTNLDVQSPALTGAVVTFGASITDGYASTQNANHRWPNFLAQRLSAAGIDVGVINQGVSGNQLLNNNNTLSALNRFQHDVVGQPNVRWVIFSDDPINDVGNNPSITGAQLIAGVKQLISQAHSNGLKFLGSTLTPFKGASYWTSAGETAREQYNAFVLSPSSGCDGVIDQDNATHDPNNPTQYLPAFDSGDHLHPNDAGYQAIANAVNLSFFGTQTQTESPFGGIPAAIPGTIQNENYDLGGEGLAYNVTSINGTANSYRSDGVDLETTSDTGGGFDLGWTSSAQWFKYTVNVTTAGTYTVSFRIASSTAVGSSAGSFHLQTPSGTNLSGAINVPGTGGWQTWTTITANVTLPASQQIIELFEDTGGYNLNFMTFASAASQMVIAPVFSPGSGTYTSAQNLSIASTTSGASIRYTTDGSPPSETAGTIYSGPVNIGATTTLKALAYKSGFTDSPVTSGTYTITTTTGKITLQASSLSPTGSGQAISTAADAAAPGGTWVKIASTAVGQWIQFTTPSIPAGTYSLSFIYRTNTTRAQHNVTIDGTQVGTTIVDQYAPGATATYPPAVAIGSVTFGTAGTHTIRLTATGKNAASTSYQISAVQFIFQ